MANLPGDPYPGQNRRCAMAQAPPLTIGTPLDLALYRVKGRFCVGVGGASRTGGALVGLFHGIARRLLLLSVRMNGTRPGSDSGQSLSGDATRTGHHGVIPARDASTRATCSAGLTCQRSGTG